MAERHETRGEADAPKEVSEAHQVRGIHRHILDNVMPSGGEPFDTVSQERPVGFKLMQASSMMSLKPDEGNSDHMVSTASGLVWST